MFQTWFTVFVAVTGVLSLLPYRERALLPAPSGTEQGLLAQDISANGPETIVDQAIRGTDGLVGRDGLAGRGARRLIAGGPRGATVPGTAGLAGTPSALLPGTGGGANGAGADGAVGAPGVGPVALAGNQGGLNPGGSPAGPGNPPTGPQGPAVLSGAAGELLAAVVPEPSTWLMFIVGMLALGQALRLSGSRQLRMQARS